ncbi:MAG: hypothetical protein ACP5VP_01895 [Candidatus Limnocylindrales bacterium]
MRAPDAPTAEAYRRAASQRCWACNAPDSEPVRLQRQVGEDWVTEATVQLCTACLTALSTPLLVRQLGLDRRTEPRSANPVREPSPEEGAAAPGRATEASDAPPLKLLRGA